MFQNNKIFIEYELKGILVCKINSETKNDNNDDNMIDLILKNIIGTKKKLVLSSNVNEIDLNLLLENKFRNVHNKFIFDIAINKQKSKYWDKFLNGKMSRNIEIINPMNHNVFSSNLIINLIEHNVSKNEIYFDVIFNDINPLTKKNEPIVLTHELDSLVSSSLSIIHNLKQDYNDINIDMLNDLMNEIKNILDKTKKTVLDDVIISFTKDNNIENNYENTMINNFVITLIELIKITKKISNDITINYSIEKIESFVDENLKKNIINDFTKFINILFEFINNVYQPEIEINIYETNKNSIINIKISNINNINKFIENINKKTQVDEVHEVDEFNKYKLLVEYMEDVLYIKIVLEKKEKPNNKIILNNKQIEKILNIDHNKKIYILIDDSILNLKLLSANLLRFKNIDLTLGFKKFPKLTSSEWQDIGILLLEVEEFIIVLLSNGEYGKQVSLLLNPQVIITDVQMPQLNGIDMIKDLIYHNVKSKMFVISAYLNNTDIEAIKFLEENNIKYFEKNGTYDWMTEIFD